jgi:hypothetical protein
VAPYIPKQGDFVVVNFDPHKKEGGQRLSSSRATVRGKKVPP